MNPASLEISRKQQKQRYQADLKAQQADCEANYLRLSKLMLNMDDSELLFGLNFSDKNYSAVYVRLNVVEMARYTTTVQMSYFWQYSERGLHSQWLKAPNLKIRIYHDARMAEVIEWHGQRRCTLPVLQALKLQTVELQTLGHHMDERIQWNRFLAEWLNHCLAFGHVLQPLRFGFEGES